MEGHASSGGAGEEKCSRDRFNNLSYFLTRRGGFRVNLINKPMTCLVSLIQRDGVTKQFSCSGSNNADQEKWNVI